MLNKETAERASNEWVLENFGCTPRMASIELAELDAAQIIECGAASRHVWLVFYDYRDYINVFGQQEAISVLIDAVDGKILGGSQNNK